MSEFVRDGIKEYGEMRNRVERYSDFAIIAAVILLAVAKSPQFHLKDFFGLTDGKIHNGYVAAYGCFVIWVLAAKLHWGILSCLSLRSRVIRDMLLPSVKTDSEEALASVEFLLRLPFQIPPSADDNRRRFTRLRHWSKRLLVFAPSCLLCVGYGIFAYFYLNFYNPGSSDSGLWDLFIGPGHWRGFPAKWKLMDFEGGGIFLNAPPQTWIYVVGAIYVAVTTIWWGAQVFGAASPYGSQDDSGWLRTLLKNRECQA